MTRRQRIDDLTTFALPGQPALSPDGIEVVYVLTTVDAAADKNLHSLWRAPVPASPGPNGRKAQVTTPDNANKPNSGVGRGPDGRDAGRREARQLTRGEADSSPAWSPDGTKVAFLRADGGPAQIWMLPANGGEPEQVTSLPLGAWAPVWSPDGTKIAFGAPVDPRAVPGEDDAARAKRANAPLVADRLDYQADGAGLIGPVRKHLHVLDLASGQVRQVTKGDWHASDPVWSPGSARLAFGAATAPDADLNLRVPVYVVDVSGAGDVPEPVLAALATGLGAPVAWAPDGAALLIVGATGEKSLIGHTRLFRIPLPAGTAADPHRDRGSQLGSARTAEPIHPIRRDMPPAKSGRSDDRGSSTANIAAFDPRSLPEPLDLASALDRNVMPGGPGYPGGTPQFADGGDTVLFCVRDRGCSHVYAVPADGSAAPRPVVTGAGRVVSGLSVAGGTAVVVLATPTSFGEVVAIDLASGVESVLTAHGTGRGGKAPEAAVEAAGSANDPEDEARGDAVDGSGTTGGGTRDDVELFVRQEREFAISDGTVVQGWLTRVGDVTTLVLPARDGLCCPVGQAQQWCTAPHEQGPTRLVLYRSLSLSDTDSEHHPAGGRERSSAAWSGGHSRRPVAVFRHRVVAAAKPSGDPPSLARPARRRSGVALTPGSVRSRPCHTCPSARLHVFNANIRVTLEISIVRESSRSNEQLEPRRVAPLHT